MTTGLLLILDDTAALCQRAAAKTIGVIGDDLALNAQQVVGLTPARELPVIGKIAAGALANKVVLVPLFIGLSAAAPALIQPLLAAGGAYLCYEGAEKILHKITHKHDDTDDPVRQEEAVRELDNKALENQKVKDGIITDVVLSAEILAIALNEMTDASIQMQALALSAVGVGMTVGVYSIVAALVKMDDIALHMMESTKAAIRKLGRGILLVVPRLMQALSVIGTVAMLTVGGSIVAHVIPPVHHIIEQASHATGAFGWVTGTVLDGVFGVLAGLVIIPVVSGFGKVVKLVRKRDDV